MALLYSSRGRMSGSVGMDTFRKGENGATIMSAKVVEQTNPKTRAQAEQRVKFATCGKAYSFLKSIVNHSFTGIKDGSKCYQHFMKVNLPLVQDGNGNFAAKGQKYAVRNYIVASGPVANSTNVIGMMEDHITLSKKWNTAPSGSSLTFGQLQTIFPELLPGMELAVVAVTASEERLNPRLFKARVTIAPDAVSSTPVGTIADGIITLGGNGIVSSFGDFKMMHDSEGALILTSHSHPTDYWPWSACVVLSRQGLREVEYSDAQMMVPYVTPLITSFEEAVLDYQATDDKFLDQVDK